MGIEYRKVVSVPVSQIKSLFKSEKTTANAKESKKQKEKVVAQENGTKKQKKVDKPPAEQPKPKPPKNIESALTGVRFLPAMTSPYTFIPFTFRSQPTNSRTCSKPAKPDSPKCRSCG